ncbi:MAG: NTP transferase domain-containing protein [Pseudomonadota bacterium]
MITAAAVLAAGRSKRFGAEDKLLAVFKGQPLGAYVAQAIDRLDIEHHMVAYRSEQLLTVFDGFESIHANARQSDSLKACVKRAKELGVDRLLVALADMPFVETVHFERLLACDPACISALSDGIRASVPACFPNTAFDALLKIDGDIGARDILQAEDVVRVDVAPEILNDIDTPAALSRYSN